MTGPVDPYPHTVAEAEERKPSFPEEFDAEFGVGPGDGNNAYFGHNVLRG